MPTLADVNPARVPIQGIIFGAPGSGKSVLAHQFPRTRTLDFDAAAGSTSLSSVLWAIREGIINKKPEEVFFEPISEKHLGPHGVVVASSAIEEAEEIVDGWLKERELFDTIIVDSGSGLTDVSINKGLAENARLKLSQSLSTSKGAGFRVMRKQDWGSGSSIFQQFVTWLRSLGKNVIITAHRYSETDEGGNLIEYVPMLIGQLRQNLPKDFSEVWYTTVSGSRTKPTFEIQTKPGANVKICKSRLGCLEGVERGSFETIADKVSAYWGVERSLLWQGLP